MTGRLKIWGLGLALAALLIAGCSDVLLESKQADGRLERVKLDTGESWDVYDDHPRSHFDRRKSYDEMSIMLKRETTF